MAVLLLAGSFAGGGGGKEKGGKIRKNGASWSFYCKVYTYQMGVFKYKPPIQNRGSNHKK